MSERLEAAPHATCRMVVTAEAGPGEDGRPEGGEGAWFGFRQR